MMKLFKLVAGFLLVIVFADAQPPGEWMWIKGSNTANVVGSFGTQGISSPTNVPPALYEASEWTDLNGNFWLFGGEGPGGLFSALWKYNPITNQWTWIKGPNTPGSMGSYGVQGVPSPTNNPSARGHGVVSWIDLQGNFWLFGGNNFVGSCGDLWKYEIATNIWTWMKGPNTPNNAGVYGVQGIPGINNYPPTRWETATGWTSNSGDIWLFGGLKGSPYANFNDLWRYNIATNTWTWMKGSSTVNQPSVYGTLGVESPLNTPGARNCYCRWKDNQGNLWLFGGEQVINSTTANFYNDLWRYNPITNNWAWMGGSNLLNNPGQYGTKCTPNPGNMPGKRYETRAAWTDSNGNLWLFGGGFGLPTTVTVYNDLWVYRVNQNDWIWVSGDNTYNPIGYWGVMGVPNILNKPNGRHASVGWRDNNGHLYFFGGSNTSYALRYNDLWKYTIDYGCLTVPVSVSVSNDTSICQGNCTAISATAFNGVPPYTYSWSPNIGSGAGPFTICPLTSTNYTVVVSDAIGGSATDSVAVTVNLLPPSTITPGGSVNICFGDSIALHANTGANLSYQWYQNNVLISGATDSIYTVINPADYSVVVTDNVTGCSATSGITTVNAMPLPSVNIVSNSINACNSNITLVGWPNPCASLTAVSSTAVSYLWSTGDTTQSICVSQSGVYSVIVWDANGCASQLGPSSTITLSVVNILCGQNQDKIIFCHVPPGNPGNPQTICIPPSAIIWHLTNHPGDCIGPCNLYYPRISFDEDFEESINSEIKIHSNPFTNILTIETTTGDILDKIILYTTDGHLLKTIINGSTNSLTHNSSIITIDVSDLSAGIYVLDCESEKGREKVKVVKY
jgi:N-acetylneuraminic acid mutarotase